MSRGKTEGVIGHPLANHQRVEISQTLAGAGPLGSSRALLSRAAGARAASVGLWATLVQGVDPGSRRKPTENCGKLTWQGLQAPTAGDTRGEWECRGPVRPAPTLRAERG